VEWLVCAARRWSASDPAAGPASAAACLAVDRVEAGTWVVAGSLAVVGGIARLAAVVGTGRVRRVVEAAVRMRRRVEYWEVDSGRAKRCVLVRTPESARLRV
jgi:hypothetical protein